MHNWHLLLFLIHSLLQPIFSDHIQFDGGRYSTYSSRTSLPDERLSSHRQHRIEKLAPEYPDLRDNAELRRYNHRNEPTPTNFYGDRRLEHRTLPPDERNQRYKDKQLRRLATDVRGNIHSLADPNFIYQKADPKATSLYGSLAYKEKGYNIRAPLDNGIDKNQHMFERKLRKRDLTRIFENDVTHRYLREHNDVKQGQEERHIICSNDFETFKPSKPQKKNILTKVRNNISINKHSDIGGHARNRNNDGVCIKRSIRQSDLTNGEKREAARNHICHDSRLNARRTTDSLDVNKRVVRNTRKEFPDFTNSIRYSRSSERRILNDNARRITGTEMNNRDEGNKNIRNEHPKIKNYDRSYLGDYTRERSTSTLERDGARENAERIRKRHITRNLQNQNKILREEPDNLSSYRIYSVRDDTRETTRNLGRGLYHRDARRITNTDSTLIRKEQTFIERIEPLKTRSYVKHKSHNRDNVRFSEHDQREKNARRIIENHFTTLLKDTNIGTERFNIINNERHSKDSRNRAISVERIVTEDNARKIIKRHVSYDVQERNIYNTRDETTEIRNNEISSIDPLHKRLSLHREMRQENTRRITELQGATHTEDGIKNVRNKAPYNRNYEGYSRDTSDRTRSLESGVYQKNRRLTKRNDDVPHYDDENQNVRNDLPDISRYERHSRNARDRTLSLDRTLQRDNIRNYEYISRDNRNGIFSSERGVRKENTRRVIERNSISHRTEELQKERNEPLDVRNIERGSRNTPERKVSLDQINKNERTDIRNYERFSPDNRDRTLSMERGIRKENTRRFTERNDISQRVEEKKMIRNEPLKIRSYERYSRNSRDGTLSLNRAVHQENMRRITESLDDSRHKEQSKNVRNKPTNIRNSENYSRDSRDRTLSLNRAVHQENMRRTTESLDDSLHKEESKNVRNKPTNIRNSESYSRGNRDRILSLERVVYQENPRIIERKDAHHALDIIIRNGPTTIKNYERFLRDDRDKTLSVEREVRRANMRRITERQSFSHRIEEMKNVRHEPNNIRKVERRSRDIRDSVLSLERGVRKDYTRRVTAFVSLHDIPNLREKNKNVRNEPLNIRSYKMSRDTGSRMLSLDHTTDRYQENSRRIKEKHIVPQREEEFEDVGNKQMNIRNYGSYLGDTQDETLSLDRAVHKENTRRITERHYGSYREGENKNVRNKPANIRNYERFSRVNSDRILSLEYGVPIQNMKRITERQRFLHRIEENKNVRNEVGDRRNYEMFLRDNRARTLSLERRVREENTRRIIHKQTLRTEEGRENVRSEPLNIRSDEKSSPNTRDRNVRKLQPNIRNIRNYVRETGDRTSLDRRQEYARIITNIRNTNESSNNRNYERYSFRVNTREISTSSLARHGLKEDSRRITNNARGIEIQKREEIIRNVRNEPTHREYERRNLRVDIRELRTTTLGSTNNVRRIKMYSVSNRLVRSTRERHGLTDIKNNERLLSRTNDRSKMQSSGRDVRKENENKLATRQINPYTHLIQDKYLRDNIQVRAISTLHDVREMDTRRISDTRSVRNREVSDSNRRDETTKNRHFYLRSIGGENRGNRPLLSLRYLREDFRKPTSSIERQLRQLSTKTGAERIERHSIKKGNEHRIQNYPKQLNHRDGLINRSRRLYLGNDRLVKNVESDQYERHARNTFTGQSRDNDIRASRRNIESNIILSSTTQKDSITTTESVNILSSIFGWHYLFYALQGIYIIGVFMQGNAKTSSLTWLSSSRLLKVD